MSLKGVDTDTLMSLQFGSEWIALSRTEQRTVDDDFRELLKDEYDVPDDTMSGGIAEDNAIQAASEYRRRIGGGNLSSYVRSLMAQARRRAV